MKAGVAAALVAILAALLALSCASEPPAPEPVPEPAPIASLSVRMGDIGVLGVDIDTVRVETACTITNDGETAVGVAESAWKLAVASVEIEDTAEPGAAILSPGNSLLLTLVRELDAPPGEEPLVDLVVGLDVSYRHPDGTLGTASASAAIEFPRITAPTLQIRMIRILKDELINTRLGVDLTVINPNVFPVLFTSLDYKLYGEGRYWASGSLAKAFDVPALGSAEASLYLTMNFTGMDRALLDSVIKLSEVDYRLVGSGGVDTGLEFLPRFDLPFDLAGRVTVR